MVAGGRLDEWFDFCAVNDDLQQFGQTHDVSTMGGHTGCMHTELQRIVLAVTGHRVTHDEISAIARYPWPAHNPTERGLTYGVNGHSEVERVIAHFKLPYKVVLGLSFDEVHDAVEKAPAIIAVKYLWWPEHKGTVYNGHKADGQPGGYAYHGGKTQLEGFTGAHAVLYIGGRVVKVGRAQQRRLYANDPNHGSASRPEQPDYDAVKPAHLQRAYERYHDIGGRALMAIVPTRSYHPKGR